MEIWELLAVFKMTKPAAWVELLLDAKWMLRIGSSPLPISPIYRWQGKGLRGWDAQIHTTSEYRSWDQWTPGSKLSTAILFSHECDRVKDLTYTKTHRFLYQLAGDSFIQQKPDRAYNLIPSQDRDIGWEALMDIYHILSKRWQWVELAEVILSLLDSMHACVDGPHKGLLCRSLQRQRNTGWWTKSGNWQDLLGKQNKTKPFLVKSTSHYAPELAPISTWGLEIAHYINRTQSEGDCSEGLIIRRVWRA